MILYHYTCRDQMAGISAIGVVRPHRHPLFPDMPPVIWLSDLDVPDRGWLGLTMNALTCDRTEYRLAVTGIEIPQPLHWPAAAHLWKIPQARRAAIEAAPAKPMHWWVSTAPIELRHVDITDLGGRLVA